MLLIKPLVLVASLVSGGSLFGYALTVQEQRGLEPVSLEPSPTAVQVIGPPMATRISEPEPLVLEPAVLELPEVVIEPSASYRSKPAAAPEAAPERVKSACSDWRELGPQYVNSRTTATMHEVRELCD